MKNLIRTSTLLVAALLFATIANAASYTGPVPQGPKFQQLRDYLAGRATTPGKIPQGPKWGALRSHIQQLEAEKQRAAEAQRQAQVNAANQRARDAENRAAEAERQRKLAQQKAQAPKGFSDPGVNGRNVGSVQHRGGSFVQTTSRGWVERDQSGIDRYRFEEQNRDDWSVYLLDASRGVNIQLDLHTKKIYYSDRGSSRRELYAIADARRMSGNLPASAPSIPRGRTYIKAADSNLYLHTSGGSKSGGHQTLHACPRANNHGNCQWILEPSPTRSGAYYIRASDANLYLHSSGGSKSGAHNTLHPCPKGNNHGNCQWTLEPSSTISGAYYIRSSDAGLYLHTSGGSRPGYHNTLHPCPKGNNHGNCQWFFQ